MNTNIVSIDALAAEGRCEIASVSLVLGEPGYESEVLLPDDDWAPLAADQVAALRPPSGMAGVIVHEIIRIPVGFEELERIRSSSVEFKPFENEQRIDFDPFSGRHASEFIGHVDSPAGQRSTTVDQRVGKRDGIHLDNFDQLSLDKRKDSRRRLALNLGPGHRFLLLATIDILDIAALCPISGEYPRTADVREFVRRGGTLNCVRIRIEPGEGYVAPTELVPHDGSTQGVALHSRIAFWLGHWPTGVFSSVVS